MHVVVRNVVAPIAHPLLADSGFFGRDDAPLVEIDATLRIDVSIARFATLPDGSIIAPLNSFKRSESALRRAQRALSRKTRFRSHWKKA